MQQSFEPTRRQFLKHLSLGAVLIPLSVRAVLSREPEEPGRVSLASLITVLRKQASYYDVTLSEEEIGNLTYAFERISPRSHVEWAFVVAMGCPTVCGERRRLTDEFVRRRAGQPSQLWDHPLFALEFWGRPDTHRILIFKEQLLTLIQELTDCGIIRATELFYGCVLARRSEWRRDIEEGMARKYGDRLAPEEIATILRAVDYYSLVGRPYSWCSAMVSRAEALGLSSGIAGTFLLTR